MGNKIVSVFKARKTNKPVNSVIIRIQEEMPEFPTLSLQETYCMIDAEHLAGILFYALPKLTYEKLLALMLKQGAISYQMLHPELAQKEDEHGNMP